MSASSNSSKRSLTRLSNFARPGEASQLNSAVDVRVFDGLRELLVNPVTIPEKLLVGFLFHLKHRALVRRERDLLRRFLRRHVVLDDLIIPWTSYPFDSNSSAR
jgi:hypothetical protein